jgi:hypothetical protein
MIRSCQFEFHVGSFFFSRRALHTVIEEGSGLSQVTFQRTARVIALKSTDLYHVRIGGDN